MCFINNACLTRIGFSTPKPYVKLEKPSKLDLTKHRIPYVGDQTLNRCVTIQFFNLESDGIELAFVRRPARNSNRL